MVSKIDEVNALLAQWQTITLKGGPRDGETLRVHQSDDVVRVHVRGRPFIYRRVSAKLEFVADTEAKRLFGKGQR